jgi:hypothetical protein
MRLSIYDQFVVGVIRPNGGWSKGRPIAFIEEEDKCVPLFNLLIPNDLDDEDLVHYVSGRFAAFAQPGKGVASLEALPVCQVQRHKRTVRRRGVAHPQAHAGVQR